MNLELVKLGLSILTTVFTLSGLLFGQCEIEPNEPLIEIRGINLGALIVSGDNEEWNSLGNEGYTNFQELIPTTTLWPGNKHDGYAWLFFNPERVEEIQDQPFIKVEAFIHSEEIEDEEWSKIGESQTFEFELESYLEQWEEAQNEDKETVDPVGIPLSLEIPIETNEGSGVLRLIVTNRSDVNEETYPCEPNGGEVEDYAFEKPKRNPEEPPSLEEPEYILLEDRPGAWYHTTTRENGLFVTFPYRYSAEGEEGSIDKVEYSITDLTTNTISSSGLLPVRRGQVKLTIPIGSTQPGSDYLLTVKDVDLDELRYLRFRVLNGSIFPE